MYMIISNSNDDNHDTREIDLQSNNIFQDTADENDTSYKYNTEVNLREDIFQLTR